MRKLYGTNLNTNKIFLIGSDTVFNFISEGKREV